MSDEFQTQETLEGQPTPPQQTQEAQFQQTYQPIGAAPEGAKPAKKSGRGMDALAGVVSCGVFILFGVVGGLICFGGYWLVKLIVKSKMPTAAKVILSVLVILVFLVLLLIVIGVAAYLNAES